MFISFDIPLSCSLAAARDKETMIGFALRVSSSPEMLSEKGGHSLDNRTAECYQESAAINFNYPR